MNRVACCITGCKGSTSAAGDAHLCWEHSEQWGAFIKGWELGSGKKFQGRWHWDRLFSVFKEYAEAQERGLSMLAEAILSGRKQRINEPLR